MLPMLPAVKVKTSVRDARNLDSSSALSTTMEAQLSDGPIAGIRLAKSDRSQLK
jgi:hypothetical protein